MAKKLFLKKLLLKEDHQHYANGYRGIGNIKYGSEEYKFGAAKVGHPGGIIALQNREIEHIYYPSVKESAVASIDREKAGHFKIIAAAENHAVKGAVNHIANCSG